MDKEISLFERLLSNFSEELLQSFLPAESLNFLRSLIQENNEDKTYEFDFEKDKSIKKQLIRIVSTTIGPEFIFNKELRDKLIESLQPLELIEVFIKPEDNFSKTITPQHYTLIQDWADNNLKDFAKKLEMLEEYEAGLEQAKIVPNISYVEPTYPLYGYQSEIVKKILDGFEKSKQRQLLHLPTGAGKTRTAMHIVAEHLKQSPHNLVLWFADREELCSQAVMEFKKAWTSLGNRALTAYGFYSESDESLSGIDSGFIVAGLHKFLSIRRNKSRQYQLLYEQLTHNVTLIVFDEAHKAVAKQFKYIVEDFINSKSSEAKLLGLTATPGRAFSLEGFTKEDKKLTNFFHKNKISMEVPGYFSPIEFLVEKQYLAKANFKPLYYTHSRFLAYELSNKNENQTLEALANNVERNQKILETIENECQQGSSIIVFSCTAQHATNLATALAARGIKAASISSKYDSKESRQWKIENYKKGKLQVLTNYNILTAGFDAPITNVAVIARPMNSLVQYLQMAGRAMRGKQSGGNIECSIYTVMDDIPQFQSISLGFQHWNEMWSN